MALCPPAVTLPDAGTYRASEAQLEIWQAWLEFWEIVKGQRSRGRSKKRLIVIINGEVIDGDHHNTSQLITRSEIGQLRVAYQATEPIWKLKPDDVYVIRGTEAHSGTNGQWDEAFAADIGAHSDEQTKTYSWWWLPLKVENVLFDIAHHGKSGYQEWTGPNALNTVAVNTVLNYTRTGDPVPALVLRGHVHRQWDSGDNYQVRVLLNPSWQLATSHGQRIAPGQILPIGGNIISVDDDRYTVDKIHYWPKRRIPVEA